MGNQRSTYWVTILAVFLILIGTSTPRGVAGEVPELTVSYDKSVKVPKNHRSAILRELESSRELLPGYDAFSVTAARNVANWIEYTLLPTQVLESNWATFRPDQIIKLAVEDSTERKADAYIVSVGLHGPLRTRRDYPDLYTSPVLVAAEPFKFPWTSGDTWYKTQGWHYGDAIDFRPPAGGDKSVLAASNGSASVICTDGYQVTMIVSNEVGTATYAHLAASGARIDLDGKSIARGQYLGSVYDGSAKVDGYCDPNPDLQYNTHCGCGTGAHVHFVSPSRSLTIDGNDIDTVATSPYNSPWVSSNTRVDGICCGCLSTFGLSGNQLSSARLFGPSENEVADMSTELDASGRISVPEQWDKEQILADTISPDNRAPAFDVGTADSDWRAMARRATFIWPAATDADSGIAGYYVYWGPDEGGQSAEFVSEPIFTVAPDNASGGPTVYYLRVAPLDRAGNLGAWQTIRIWRYDHTAPIGSLKARGGGTTSMLPTILDVSATDAQSGVSAMRFSTDGENWTTWEPYARTRSWQLADVEGPQTIFAQFRDAVGNESELVSTTVSVDLAVEPPSSTSYRVSRSVMGMGGGTKSSLSYLQLGTSGQLFRTGVMQSTDYRVSSGYWGRTSSNITAVNLDLKTGWNMVSSPLLADDPVLSTLLAGIADDVVLMKDNAGNIYWPAYDIDSIGSWDARQAYQIYMSSPATLVMSGVASDPASMPIPLSRGWSMPAYLRRTALPIEEALASVGGSLVLVKNGAGQIYWPAYDIDTIGEMQPGQGYQLYMSSPGTLLYPGN